ncbi:very short patch repair endonuclease [Photorhabdus laumondii]|uniref:Very short patch repair endonuclease n=1 Tax=Photorhabdus laumondii subsp. clarkei TaxID=2029685 RepID=A0A329VD85_9GAMM|nr:DNA mismatch endonuclease Vsr [Photorhabdus laumondii]RAW87479.1 very short patch repair endonuclease [Photorhabdus laumondii subsp. clarkei]
MSEYRDKEARSKNMRAIRKENTDIEQIVSDLLCSLELVYEVQVSELSGKPDFVLSDYHAVIFVHGCFWHHHNCKKATLPKTHRDFWKNKIKSNILRDRRNISSLLKENWRVLIVWECSLKGKNRLTRLELCERLEEWICEGPNYSYIDSKGIHFIDERIEL